MQGKEWLIGIDEVGRGPLAGPVGVGVVKIPIDFDWDLLPGVGDSKAVSEKRRKRLYEAAQVLRQESRLDFWVELVPATYIDAEGIVSALTYGMRCALDRLSANSNTCYVKLDGSLRAPVEYQQETIIKGDAKEAVIGLASIVAKVTRDTYMEQLHEAYPQYGFSSHKGYGTLAHRTMIAEHGLSPVHRASYCQNIKLRGRV